MKVIFLDIDGVLNSDETANPRNLPYIVDERLLARLRLLLERCKAEVVLTSSWRIDPIGLYAAKFWNVPFLDVCPDMPDRPRREEILAWLARHPSVTRFVVVDDDDDQLDDLPLFQPSGKHGLTPELAAGIERYLDGKTDEVMRAGFVKRTLQNVMGLFQQDKD
jgi:Swiss Army Knife RNA repair-like protein